MSDKIQEALFHYTTTHGAFGIIESQNLHATDIRYLNDLAELDHFKGFILDQLYKLLQLLIPHYDASSIADTKLNAPQIASAIVQEIESLVDIFTISFSTPRNKFEFENGLLSQWRSYGSDGGVILDFEKQALLQLIEKEKLQYAGNNFQYKHVTYGDDEEKIGEMRAAFDKTLADQFESFLTRLISLRKSTRRQQINEQVSQALKEDMTVYGDLVSRVSEWAIYFKHLGFKEENEFRVSIERPYYRGNKDKGVLFRMRSDIPTPYALLFTDDEVALPIRRVVVGPHRDARDRANAFQKLCDRRGIQAYVEISQIPFV